MIGSIRLKPATYLARTRHAQRGRWVARCVGVLLLACVSRVAAGELAPLPLQPPGLPWPTGAWAEGSATGVDASVLEAAVASVFEDRGRAGLPETRALLIVQGGRMVLERYAEDFGRDTHFHGWSMAKSVTQALLGTLVNARRLRIDQRVPVPAWQAEGDPRAALTIDHLLQMSSGLDNGDGFGGDPAEMFVARMMFAEGATDVAAYASAPPLVHPPGTRWAYSTGTSMILAWVLGRTVGSGRENTIRYANQALFGPIGMKSAVMEFDAAGTYLGGGFFWATARDWARFGYLYLRNGVWEGRRVLPDGWVDYTRTQAPAENNGSYGAHFWLNLAPGEDQPPRLVPGGPVSAFAALGNGGQYVLIVPTRDLVLVRLGELQEFEKWKELGRKLGNVVAAFPAIADETEAAP
jgi:CubicO group peptidase (beta-lactamase class C family)